MLCVIERTRQTFPQYRDLNSPSQRVGGEPIDAFRTVAHALPMQSIDNTYSVEDLRAWHDRVVKGLGPDAGAAYVCDGQKKVAWQCEGKMPCGAKLYRERECE